MSFDPSPIVAWSLDPARDTEDEATLVQGFVQFLVAAGFQLKRVSTSFRPLDPQVWSRAVIWTDGEATVEDRTRDTRQSPEYIGSPAEAIHRGSAAIRERLDPASPSQYALLRVLAKAGATDYLIQPITLNGEIRTFLAYTGTRPGGFTDEELAFLHAIHPAIANVVRFRSARLTVGALARTYLGPNAATRVLAGAVERGHGEQISAAIWFCDLRDFTVLTDQLPAEQLLRALDMYFECVAGPVSDSGGEILKFIGDAMLAIFPVGAAGPRDACMRACTAAVGALDRYKADLAPRSRAELGVELGFGVSLHLGDVFYGNIGARDRLDFTVIGSAVNHAARVQGQCSAVGVPILMTQPFVDHVARDDLRPLGARPLKGVATPPELYTLACCLPPKPR